MEMGMIAYKSACVLFMCGINYTWKKQNLIARHEFRITGSWQGFTFVPLSNFGLSAAPCRHKKIILHWNLQKSRRFYSVCFLFISSSQCHHSPLLSPWAITYWFPCLRTPVIQSLTVWRNLQHQRCSNLLSFQTRIKKLNAWISRGRKSTWCKAQIFLIASTSNVQQLLKSVNHVSMETTAVHVY